MWKWIAVIFCIITYIQCVTFGEDNSYTCHCNNDEQCNTISGACGGGCARGWSGQSCQKQNVALGKNSSQVDVQGIRTSDLAVDGDNTTNKPDKCSDTSKDDSTRWWKVDLEQEYPIKHITIYYRSEPDWSLTSMQGFALHVNKENEKPELCYKDKKQIKEKIRNIKCKQTLTGRYVNISNLHERADSRFLVLCEVEILVCSVGTFGSDCNKFCHCLNNERCSETGQCPGRCADGWTGRTCSQKCTEGLYGEGCQKKCYNRKCLYNSSCNHVRGECNGGCSDGYILPDCSKACDNDRYGAGCSKQCSERKCSLGSSLCNNINGSCQGGCKAGFTGIDCVKRCEEDVYGKGCKKKCSDRKCKDSNLQCDHKTGECIDGCQPGYQSIDCINECDKGKYGPGCLFDCSARFCQTQDKDECRNIDGACDCLEGFHRIDCTVKQETATPRDDDPVNQDIVIIAAGVTGCVIIIVIVIIALIIRRRRTPPPVEDVISDKFLSRNTAVVNIQMQGPIYENSDVAREASMAFVAVEPIHNVYPNAPIQPTASLQPLEVQESEAGPSTETTSMNEEDDISSYLIPEKSDFNLTELEDFVKKTKPNNGFDPLYKGLPNNFTSSYDMSQIPENRKKNRFKGYYPYDVTRVVLRKIFNDPHSDYINANFIEGYDENYFIAAQGATRVTQNDFVRMIWDVKCDKVVMVTKEFEDAKRKCERYWPPGVGSSETFGVIKLTLKEEICRENYTKRCIIMERDQMKHSFYHFHYTSWPDHGVPETNDMLDFQFTVNKFQSESQSPVLVHCSAGVGRTGTYIAIDYCLKQYNDIGKVDVLECVKTLRQQRIGMVQTASQLQFVHEALIEGIKRGDTAMNKHIFESEYDKHSSKIRMWNASLKRQFSFLKTVENDREITAQSRYIVSDRTQLYRYPSHTLEFGIYFEELRNVEPTDIWKAIIQTDAKLAIFILDSTSSVSCPGLGSVETRGEFVIENKSEEKISPTLNVTRVELKTKGHPVLAVNVLISRIDKSSIKHPTVLFKHMLDIIENMVIYRSDLKPFFIFTSDIKYSQIFCILHNIVQRIRLDNEVELFKAVRKMHRLFGNVLNFQEEYNVLHAIVAKYVKSTNTYANL